MKKFITGASGFLGTRLIKFLENSENHFSVFRKILSQLILDISVVVILIILQFSSAHFKNKIIIIHTAARVHIMGNPVKQC